MGCYFFHVIGGGSRSVRGMHTKLLKPPRFQHDFLLGLWPNEVPLCLHWLVTATARAGTAAGTGTAITADTATAAGRTMTSIETTGQRGIWFHGKSYEVQSAFQLFIVIFEDLHNVCVVHSP